MSSIVSFAYFDRVDVLYTVTEVLTLLKYSAAIKLEGDGFTRLSGLSLAPSSVSAADWYDVLSSKQGEGCRRRWRGNHRRNPAKVRVCIYDDVFPRNNNKGCVDHVSCPSVVERETLLGFIAAYPPVIVVGLSSVLGTQGLYRYSGETRW